MPKMPHFQYPLNGPMLQLFGTYFRQQYGSVLFYTSEQFINSAFLEFQDSAADDGTANGALNYVLDVVAMCEDLHHSLRQQNLYTQQLRKAEAPCTKCGQSGVLPPGRICPTCGGTGRRSKKTRS